ncbi:Hint domain-containing protein [Phaeobacter sp. B1627]|nr:Hint domain-containing protein [Phaeobacter sp. B1627]
MEDLVLDDVYELADPRPPCRLGIAARADGTFGVSEDSELGRAGSTLHLDCAISLMPEVGEAVDALIMVEVGTDGLIDATYLVPQTPLAPQTGYRLLSADRKQARSRLAEMACVSFARGTRITLGTGAQIAIEDLAPGDRVLTRDSGVQPVVWIGRTTARATGSMAPILIRAGALNNDHDLQVSPDHRLMLYQRTDAIGVGTPEILVRARDLVNGHSVVVQDGGFVDYFQILFDRHYIIYAEGIAAESLLLDAVTQTSLPEALVDQFQARPRHRARAEHGLDISPAILDRSDVVGVLKRASLRC